MSELVVNGLVRKRSELAGEIQHFEERLRQMVADVTSLDAAIRVFDPEYKVETIKAKTFRAAGSQAARGDITRGILALLRNATQPLTTREIAEAMGRSVKRAGLALNAQKKKGVIRSILRPGQAMQWEVAR